MTNEEKAEIMAEISKILDKFICCDTASNPISEFCEMLTIKECAKEVKGLSEHTVRRLVARGEISSFRTGEGKRGKILVPKSSLLDYIRKIHM